CRAIRGPSIATWCWPSTTPSLLPPPGLHRPAPRPGLRGPRSARRERDRIERAHHIRAQPPDVGDITRREYQSMDPRRRGKQGGKRGGGCEWGYCPPLVSHCLIDRENPAPKGMGHGTEPAFEGRNALRTASARQFDTVPDLSQNEDAQ